jgi:hypothetical protein
VALLQKVLSISRKVSHIGWFFLRCHRLRSIMFELGLRFVLRIDMNHADGGSGVANLPLSLYRSPKDTVYLATG